MKDTDPITADYAIKILNEGLVADPNAFGSLIDIRVPCGERLARHPTIQVGHYGTGVRVGLLGIINGLFGVDVRGYGPISAILDENPDDPKGTPVLVRFERTPEAADEKDRIH